MIRGIGKEQQSETGIEIIDFTTEWKHYINGQINDLHEHLQPNVSIEIRVKKYTIPATNTANAPQQPERYVYFLDRVQN